MIVAAASSHGEGFQALVLSLASKQTHPAHAPCERLGLTLPYCTPSARWLSLSPRRCGHADCVSDARSLAPPSVGGFGGSLAAARGWTNCEGGEGTHWSYDPKYVKKLEEWNRTRSSQSANQRGSPAKPRDEDAWHKIQPRTQGLLRGAPLGCLAATKP